MIISILLGLSLGTFYGLFFVLQQRRALSLQRTSFAQHMVKSVFLSLIRFTLFALGLVYILHSSSINLILVVTSFLIPLCMGLIMRSRIKFFSMHKEKL